ncbi:MAG: cation transporter [Candidatus Omnitrophica bacterium CG1_02_44_16]|nr:MAG: cation transporter [Candidatus Omnitrophica bacterium CG1_02_44_16]PIY82626.1 MAG: cation transporter [Candidatus Omnitrophica bacterium CG_4_10_14_0_8_um_filter_44_12]PIZ85016.1 MAG: cation transporter [Candidatus Omnitrophica bacterium CG_4_10_14_0_2_um_filter_44_9]
MIMGLFFILLAVFLAPFFVKKIEEELELFLFIMGCIAVTITSQWSMELAGEALVEPIKITLAVLIAGLLFRYFQKFVAHNVNKSAGRIGVKWFAFLAIVLLGLISSVITAIIAALLLVEIISYLSLDRKHEILLVVLACFAIGLGAALTSIGEPLSTITIAKLKGIPYNAGFFFLLRHLWIFIIPGIVLFGVLGAILVPNKLQKRHGLAEDKKENIKNILVRTAKVYAFVMALIFLGKGFKPIVDTYVSKMSYQGLYWLNIVSAVLDNATLAAAEMGPSMSLLQIKSSLLGLLIAGGMLIPGNIPNIISAGKLKIKSSEWAKIGVPLGLIVMAVYFFLIILVQTP